VEDKDGNPRKPPQLPRPGNPDPKGLGNQRRAVLIWMTVLLAGMAAVQLFTLRQQLPVDIPYSEFVSLVKSGKVTKCDIVREVSGIEYIKGEFGEKDPKTGAAVRFKVYIVQADADLRKLLEEHKVEYRVPPQNPYLWQVLSSVLPVVLVFGLLYFLFMRQMKSAGHGAMSFGKSRARVLNRDRNKVTFENVAGIDEAKEEVQEIILFLKDPKRFQKLGGRIPKGVLLMGPPGTGKTLLAKAIAGEADVPFFSISGSDFVEMFVGVGASRVRDMFEQGKKNAPCIIFIDEIDAVGRSRFSGIGGGHDEREQTLNALLVEMDGFETQDGVIIVAATNRPDVLDQALLRPGRFDRQIVIDLPTVDGREAILSMHARSIRMHKDASLRRIARGTPGFSGADLANLLNEAALLAARLDKEAVDLSDLEEARDKVIWGRERRSRVMDEKDKGNTAYHEAGHAVVQQVLEDTEPLHKVTIIPRGIFMGATMSLPEKDRYSINQRRLLADLAVCMGGRVAEELVFNELTTGAYGDLRHATRLARNMVCNWGMSDALGPQTYGENQELLFLGREVTRTQDYSEDTARRIDAEVNRLLRDAHERALALLKEHRHHLDAIAKLLLDRETLDGRDVAEIVEHGRLLTEDERDAVDQAEIAAHGDPDAVKTPPAAAPAGGAARGGGGSLPVADGSSP
jgi:cell division protease FtsH